MRTGTYDENHPLIQRPDTVLAWVKPTSIDPAEFTVDLHGIIRDGYSGHDLAVSDVAELLGSYGIGETT